MGVTDQQTEIEELKASFSGKVKVISDVGDFTNVVTVYPADKNIQIKFQLTDRYPESPPTISVVCSTLNTDQLSTLVVELTNEASQTSSSINKIISRCFTWLEENEITLESSTENTKVQTKSNKKSKQKKQKNKKSEDEVQCVEKKPPMKTSLDVIKRINWDEALDKSLFIVGYMDRIVGLVERPFEDFTWEDLASVDHYSLAIPQHRIQYFKYKDEKVWDKNERLDNVFGSTGSKTTIIEAMESYEAKVRAREEQEQKGACADRKGELNDDNAKEMYSLRLDESTSAMVGAAELSCQASPSLSETTTSAHHPDTDTPPQITTHTLEARNVTPDMFINKKNFRYNFFVALEITNRSTIEKLQKVQSELIDRYPQYTPYKTPGNGFHLTLAVLSLGNIGDLQNCVIALNKIKDKVKNLAEKAEPLSFRGIDSFGTKVVFASVTYPKQLRVAVDLIKSALVDNSVTVENATFNPHLTLFKVGRSATWSSFNLNTKPYESVTFGEQLIDNIKVCKMGTLPEESKGETGFYRSVLEMNPLKPDY